MPKNLVDKIIDLLSELANSGNGNNSEVNIANQIGKISLSEKDLITDLKALVSKDNCRKGMAKYLSEYKDGELVALAQKINDGGQYLKTKSQICQ